MQHNSMYFLLRGKGQGTAGWTLRRATAGPSGWKDMLASAVGASEGCPELRHRAEGAAELKGAARAEGAAQSWGSRLLLRPCRAQLCRDTSPFRPLRTSTEASIETIRAQLPSLSLPQCSYPSLAWSAGHSPLHFLQVNIWLRVCCPGSCPRPWLHPLCRLILRISPVRWTQLISNL